MRRAAALARRGAVPLAGIAGAFLLGGLLLGASGYPVVASLVALVDGALGGRGGANLAATALRATPIVGMGLAAAVAFRSGCFNLGGEGQLVLGGLAAAAAGLYLPVADPLRLPAAIAAAALAGALWAALPAWLELRLGAPLLVTSLLLNYPARLAASYLVSHPLRDVPSGLPQTLALPVAARLPSLGDRLHWGVPAVLVAALAAAFFFRRTVAGYRMRMTGLNPRAARCAGLDPARTTWQAMLASGALAGLVGAIQVLGVHHRFIDGALTGPLWAWTGLMAALLAASHPLGVTAAGLFFAALQTGGYGMERATQVPRELSQVLQALAILLVTARLRLRFGRRGETA